MAGISTSTLTAMVAGRRRSSAETIRKVAEALRVLPEVVSSWLEHDEKVREPYVPPAESAYMSDRQRKAVTELIRAFTAEVPASDVVSGREGDDLGVDETRPGSSPAPSALGDYRDATVHQLPARGTVRGSGSARSMTSSLRHRTRSRGTSRRDATWDAPSAVRHRTSPSMWREDGREPLG
jgi:transcriptional regulator with XRE-family HTH domain